MYRNYTLWYTEPFYGEDLFIHVQITTVYRPFLRWGLVRLEDWFAFPLAWAVMLDLVPPANGNAPRNVYDQVVGPSPRGKLCMDCVTVFLGPFSTGPALLSFFFFKFFMKPKWRWIENKCSQIWLQAKYERNFRGGKKKHTSSTTYENMAIGIIMAIENLIKHLILAL
jgi:hypothetical protein